MQFYGLITMQIILSKDDIEEIIKKVFDIEAMGWNDDGSITIDTVLEKLVNEKSKFNTDDIKRMLGRAPTPAPYPYIQPTPYIQPKPIWFGPMQPGQTTITNPAGGSVITTNMQPTGYISSTPLKPKKDSP